MKLLYNQETEVSDVFSGMAWGIAQHYGVDPRAVEIVVMQLPDGNQFPAFRVTNDRQVIEGQQVAQECRQVYEHGRQLLRFRLDGMEQRRAG